MGRWSERKEAWFRLIVLIATGAIMWAWGYLNGLLVIANWLIAVFSGKRNKALAEFCEYWNTNWYRFIRYMSGMTNERPFPFSELQRISKFDRTLHN
jgi:hypothetical protein